MSWIAAARVHLTCDLSRGVEWKIKKQHMMAVFNARKAVMSVGLKKNKRKSNDK